MTDWQGKEQKYFLRTVNRVPVVLVRGEGMHVWDDEGREYLDFVGGWAVNNLGHCHPVVVEAIVNQSHTLLQASNQFYTIPQLQLAELLVEHSCLHRVFFCNSGAEANEGAIKLARKYGKLYRGGAYEVITTMQSFHGRTLAMTAATGQEKFYLPYTPLPVGFAHVEYDNVEAIRQATTPNTCAIMLEPVQGEGGVNVPHSDYLKEVHCWCDQQDILLILDEVQTGIGRTGTLFAYEQCGIEPDIVTLGKGLGGGVPLGGILASEKAAVFEPGDHGSTMGGNPLACAAGYANLKFILENNIPQHTMQVGQYFFARLMELKQEFSFITEVRGRGLLLALSFDSPIAEEVLLSCCKRGLLVNRVKPDALRFMPPLIITEAEIDRAIEILNGVLREKG